MKITFDNGGVIRPLIVGIEILRVRQEEGYIYNPQLLLILDIEKGKLLHMQTDIWEDSAYAACTRLLRGTLPMFRKVGSHVKVLDIETGKYCEFIDVNTTFKDGILMMDETDVPDEDAVVH